MSKNTENIRRCSRCALPENYPGTKLNKNNVCNYCDYFDVYIEREQKIKDVLKKKFEETIAGIKRKNKEYDCVVAFSGGKDSTFLLKYLKEKFNLKILAHTLDNGFIAEKALENIEKITEKLNIDQVFTKPDFDTSREVFKYALQGKISYPKEILAMLSPVCAACLGMVFGSTLKLAIDGDIPLMFVGFTPGQYPAISLENFLKVNSCMFLSEKVYKDDPLDIIKIIRDPINERFGEKIDRYFFDSQYIEKGLNVPVILFPFHALTDYDEMEIFSSIAELGWERPKDTDACSTNCLLNSPGNYACVNQLGYHPYIGELSMLVRQGKLSREKALEAEKLDTGSFAMSSSLEKLGLTLKDLV